MALNLSVQDRLYNWKFARAAECLDANATPAERELVEALAIFGNPGIFQGGPMEVILQAAMSTIIYFEEP